MLRIADISPAIAGAPYSTLTEVARQVWAALADGSITEAQADAASKQIEARRHELKQRQKLSEYSKPKVRHRHSDMTQRITRRRRQAASGAVPSTLAGSFTPGELAVLAVVGRQAASGRACSWPLARIAALAGVSVTTTRNALRAAERMGLVRVTERRRVRNRSLTNLVSITCRTWLTWLRRLGRGGGSKNLGPMITRVSTTDHQQAQNTFHEAGQRSKKVFEIAVRPG